MEPSASLEKKGGEMEREDRFLTCAAGLETEEAKVNNEEGLCSDKWGFSAQCLL